MILLKNLTNNNDIKKVFIYAPICVRRKVDVKKIQNYLSINNYHQTNDVREADYILLFLCGFLDITQKGCIKLIKKFQKYKGELILCGCFPDIAGEKLKEIFDGKTISFKNLDELDNIFKEKKIEFKYIKNEHSMFNNYNPLLPYREPVKIFKSVFEKSKLLENLYIWWKTVLLKKLYGRVSTSKIGGALYSSLVVEKTMYPSLNNYYILPVSMGCNFNCTYCIDKVAIGPLKSKPLKRCVEEFKEGIDKGYKNFVIDADDVGAYGQDINTNIIELLENIINIKGDHVIYLNNLHPIWIDKYLKDFEILLKTGKIKSINIAIQSANNRILKLMGRNYTKELLTRIINRIKVAYPNIRLATHFIIGFPTETEKDFQETIKFFWDVDFYYGNFWFYSAVKGTEAYEIEPKVKQKIINQRRKKLLKQLRKNNYTAWNSGLCIEFTK